MDSKNNNRSDEDGEKKDPINEENSCSSSGSSRHKLLLKSSLFVSTNLLFGVHLSLIGSTQPELVRINAFDYEELSIAASMFSVGSLLGSPFGTFCSSRLVHLSELLLAFILTAAGLTAVAIPFARHLPLLGTLWGVQGALFGSADVMCISLLMLLWQKKGPSVIGAYSAASTAGTIIGPFLAAPFLSSKPKHERNSTVVHLGEHADVGLLYVPFLIVALVGVVLAGVLLLSRLTCTDDPDTLRRSMDIDSFADKSSESSFTGTSSRSRPSGGWFFVVFAGFFIVCSIIARDIATLNFSITITSETFGLSVRSASLVGTLLNALRGFGRLLLIVLPMCVPVAYLVVVFTAFPVVCSLLLLLFGVESWSKYCALMALQTFSCSPAYPLTLAWISGLLPYDRTICGILVCANGLGGLTGMWGSGWAFVNHGPRGWFCWLLALSCSTALLVLFTFIGTYCKGKQAKACTEESEERRYLIVDRVKPHGPTESKLLAVD